MKKALPSYMFVGPRNRETPSMSNLVNKCSPPEPTDEIRKESKRKAITVSIKPEDENNALENRIRELEVELELAKQQARELTGRATKEYRRANMLQQELNRSGTDAQVRREKQRTKAEEKRADDERERADKEKQRADTEEQRANHTLFENDQLRAENNGYRHKIAGLEAKIRDLEHYLEQAQNYQPAHPQQSDNGPVYCGFTEVALRRIDTDILKKIKLAVAGKYHPDKFPPEEQEKAQAEFVKFCTLIDKIIGER